MHSVAGSCRDDMTISHLPARTTADVVEFILRAAFLGTPDDETERLLAAEFLLSHGDGHRPETARSVGWCGPQTAS